MLRVESMNGQLIDHPTSTMHPMLENVCVCEREGGGEGGKEREKGGERERE